MLEEISRIVLDCESVVEATGLEPVLPGANPSARDLPPPPLLIPLLPFLRFSRGRRREASCSGPRDLTEGIPNGGELVLTERCNIGIRDREELPLLDADVLA